MRVVIRDGWLVDKNNINKQLSISSPNQSTIMNQQSTIINPKNLKVGLFHLQGGTLQEIHHIQTYLYTFLELR